MTARGLVLRYALFAVLATLANLAAQRLVLLAGAGDAAYAAALACGTAVGLALKYLLDKRWIFYDSSSGLRAHGRKFTLYGAMGVATTLVFWGTETLFWLLWGTETMRELGAVLGLALGYTAKYHLDRRFVFTGPPARQAP